MTKSVTFFSSLEAPQHDMVDSRFCFFWSTPTAASCNVHSTRAAPSLMTTDCKRTLCALHTPPPIHPPQCRVDHAHYHHRVSTHKRICYVADIVSESTATE
eukprot:GHVO01053972.1.p1 GENE.GHVO01053972.1~~GHVO01053972.1.p1  ORF type:complete len:101 (-),score=11.77 GHVO01053972.1:152-454(-)